MDDRRFIERTNRRYRHLAPRPGGGAGETVENVKNEVAEQWIAHGWATPAGAAKEPPPRPARRK